MGIPGVANVAVWGQREQQLQVQVDPDRLRERGVSLTQVMETAGNALWVSPLTFVEASTPGTGGFIDTPSQRLSIQHISPIVTAKDLAQVAVQDADDGNILRLGEITQVVENHQPLIGDALVNDGPGLMLVVEKLPWANTAEVTRQVEAALDSMRPGLAGIEIDTTVFRPASFVESAKDNLGTALLIGLALLTVVLGAFLLSWRALLVSLVAISLSLLAAGLVLQPRGATFNAAIVAGLLAALAVVIDDAIVGVDGIRRRLRQPSEPPDSPAAEAVLTRAFLDVRGPLGYAVVIAAIAILPVFVVAGVTGAFLRPMAISYLLAILVSMLVALTVTPALSSLLLAPRPEGEAPVAGWLQRRWDAFFRRITDRSHAVLAVTGLLTAAGIALLPLLGSSMLPTFKERDLLIRWDGAPGTSQPEMARITELVSRELRSVPGVRSVGAQVGRAIASDQVVNVNSGELWVGIDPDADYDATLASVRQVVSGYPGLDRDVLTYPEDRINARSTRLDHDLAIRVFGPEFSVLASKADEIRKAIGTIDGIARARVEPQPLEPTVEIEVDLAAAQRHGIKPGDVRRAAATLVSGLPVGYLFEEQKVFEVVVWGAPEVRQSVSSLRDLQLSTPEDNYVRLGDVADVRIRPVPNVIEHDAVSRRLDVLADVRGRDVDAVIGDVDRVIKGIGFPVEYHAEVLDIGAGHRATQQQLLIYAGAALVGIYLLLQAGFGSWRLAAAVLAILPIPLLGGLLAGFLAGREISLGVLAGLLAVFAIAVR
ncbi:MAG: efflux RND transporter permease subunit, partial [Sporichthyaceae bacterium]|nr:efflux RND transporter permease subunit [Sporichthyaceae bacterium]